MNGHEKDGVLETMASKSAACGQRPAGSSGRAVGAPSREAGDLGGISSFERIPPPPIVPSNPQQIQQHAYAVSQHVHRAALAMRPVDGNLQNAIPEFPRQVENLHVKPETGNPLAGKDGFGGLPTEGLEAALRIPKIEPCDAAGTQVEQFSGSFPKAGLVLTDPLRTQPAGAKGDVVTVLQGLSRFSTIENSAALY